MATVNLQVKKRKGRFFQINYERIREIARNPDLDANCLIAYTILAGGVNASAKQTRGATHGSRSARNRTNLGQTNTELLIEQLLMKGFLTPPEELQPANEVVNPMSNEETVQSGKKKFYPVKYLVDPSYTPDMALSQYLLQRRSKGNQDTDSSASNEPRETGFYGSIIYLQNLCDTPLGWVQSETIRDALLVFFALHRHQDFELYGGVNPQKINAEMSYLSNDDDLMEQFCEVSPYHPDIGWTLKLAKKPEISDLHASDEFVFECLSDVVWSGSKATLYDRFYQAIKNLKAARMIYTSQVFWRMDGQKAVEVLYTSYVDDHSNADVEKFLQWNVNATAKAWGFTTGKAIHGMPGKEEEGLMNFNTFPYLIPDLYENNTRPLLQLRARWWPDDENTLHTLGIDALRVEKWSKYLKNVGI